MAHSVLKQLVSIIMNPKVVFVLGGPGAGKGTQCQRIVQNHGYVHLSAGDLLREERNRPGSQYGELIEKYIQEGQIVPVEITCNLLENAMKHCGKDKFLIDGFPRNQNNLEGWNKSLSHKVQLQFVLYFDCPMEVCLERCLMRGQSGSGRSDDNADSLKKRLHTYLNETKPIIDHYDELNLVKTIDASRTVAEIFGDVERIFIEANKNNAAGDY